MATSKTRYDWGRVVLLCKGGHRLFFLKDSAAVSLCDNSGDRPEFTDDGVLWIDMDELRAKGLCAEMQGDHIWTRCPLRSERDDGKKTASCLDFNGIFVFLKELGLPLELKLKTKIGELRLTPTTCSYAEHGVRPEYNARMVVTLKLDIPITVDVHPNKLPLNFAVEYATDYLRGASITESNVAMWLDAVHFEEITNP
jgi:hypothetical protein